MKKGSRTKNLRQQIEAERRKRNIFFYSIFTIVFLYIFISGVFGSRGFLKYYELKNIESNLKVEIESLQKDNEHLKGQIDSLNSDSFLREKYARESFRLAKPGEYIYNFKNNER